MQNGLVSGRFVYSLFVEGSLGTRL